MGQCTYKAPCWLVWVAKQAYSQTQLEQETIQESCCLEHMAHYWDSSAALFSLESLAKKNKSLQAMAELKMLDTNTADLIAPDSAHNEGS